MPDPSTATMTCDRPPPGWACTRGISHAGPCAAVETDVLSTLERLANRGCTASVVTVGKRNVTIRWPAGVDLPGPGDPLLMLTVSQFTAACEEARRAL